MELAISSIIAIPSTVATIASMLALSYVTIKSGVATITSIAVPTVVKTAVATQTVVKTAVATSTVLKTAVATSTVAKTAVATSTVAKTAVATSAVAIKSAAPTALISIFGFGTLGSIVIIAGGVLVCYGTYKLLFSKHEIQAATLLNAARQLRRQDRQDNDEDQKHLPWRELQSHQGGTKKGYSSKGNRYYYQKDYLHRDVQVYKKLGGNGFHIGSCPMFGGKLSKPAVPGRMISL